MYDYCYDNGSKSPQSSFDNFLDEFTQEGCAGFEGASIPPGDSGVMGRAGTAGSCGGFSVPYMGGVLAIFCSVDFGSRIL